MRQGGANGLVERVVETLRSAQKRIVVIGDSMVDHWIHGHVEECHDGYAKFIQERHITTPGGAANAHNCLDGWDVDAYIYSYPAAENPHKWRFVGPSGKVVYRWDDDRVRSAERWFEHSHVYALKAIEGADAVLLTDYDKGFLTPEYVRQVVTLCTDRAIICVADMKRAPEMYAGAILKCNYDYSVAWGCQADVITDGPNDPYIDGSRICTKLPRVKCVNHVGAGDCFAAHLTLGIACGLTLEDATALAFSAGRVYVQHQHNRPPQPEEIAADMG